MTGRIVPRAIRIDASAHCQLECPSCPTATGAALPALGAGHLRLQDFIALLDRNPEIEDVELSNYGEMFLNPQLPEMLRAAFERKVVLRADNGVNLNFASDSILEALVQYRFRSMTCSIDGASPESYRQYRIKGDFDRVIAHIRRLNEFKRKHQSGYPFLNWQFIVFGHNEHEISAARAMAAELQMDFTAKLSWNDSISPIRDRGLVQLQLPGEHLSREEYHRATGRTYGRAICHQLWHRPVLNWDGRVNGCSCNFWGHFAGNAFDTDLADIVNSDDLRDARRMLMGGAPERDDLPCSTCGLYQGLKRDQSWLTEAELSAPRNGVACSIVIEPEEAITQQGATHVDIFMAPGRAVNPVLLDLPPKALRFEVGRSFAVLGSVPHPGDYNIYALPTRLDPADRQRVPLAPITKMVTVAPRPIAQEFRIAV